MACLVYLSLARAFLLLFSLSSCSGAMIDRKHGNYGNNNLINGEELCQPYSTGVLSYT